MIIFSQQTNGWLQIIIQSIKSYCMMKNIDTNHQYSLHILQWLLSYVKTLGDEVIKQQLKVSFKFGDSNGRNVKKVWIQHSKSQGIRSLSRSAIEWRQASALLACIFQQGRQRAAHWRYRATDAAGATKRLRAHQQLVQHLPSCLTKNTLPIKCTFEMITITYYWSVMTAG